MNIRFSDVCYFLAALFAFCAAGGLSLGTINLLALAVALIALGLLIDR
jgi:hypothetical protein